MGNVPHFDESRLRLPQQLHGCAHGDMMTETTSGRRRQAPGSPGRPVWPPVAVAVAVADGASGGVAVAVEVGNRCLRWSGCLGRGGARAWRPLTRCRSSRR